MQKANDEQVKDKGSTDSMSHFNQFLKDKNRWLYQSCNASNASRSNDVPTRSRSESQPSRKSHRPYNNYHRGYKSHRFHFHDRRRKICCVNCGKEGHVYKQCTDPITSFGIIAMRKQMPTKNPTQASNEKYKCELHTNASPDTIPYPEKPNTRQTLFLMVQRKDTIGFIDFIRGKYPDDAVEQRKILKTDLEEMTCEERMKLSTECFEDLWDLLWINKLSMLYINEYMEAKSKFEKLDVKNLLQETTCRWTQQEYGFPKGRKNMYETNIECAIREFKEETGYTSDQFRILSDKPWEEVFVGTNGVTYRHVYYLAEMSQNAIPKIPLEDVRLAGEISNMGWFTYDQCMKIIRPYDQARKDLLTKVREKLGL